MQYLATISDINYINKLIKLSPIERRLIVDESLLFFYEIGNGCSKEIWVKTG